MNVKKCNSLITLNKICNLRYEVYCTEQNKSHLNGTDHANRIITDSYDLSGLSKILYVSKDEEIVGSLRYRAVSDIKKIESRYGICSDNIIGYCSEVEYFIIKKAFRKSRIALLLACEIYRIALLEGTANCFIEVEEELEKFYNRLGFVTGKTIEYSYGKRVQMCLSLFDYKHLSNIQSPFLKYFESTHKNVLVA